MPLPPPPGKRAAVLTHEALERTTSAPATPAWSGTSKPQRSAKPVDKGNRADPDEVALYLNKSQSLASKPHPIPASHKRDLATAKTKKKTSTGPTKLFVLDTNVLMHDPMCLFRFEEHDVFLPMIVLEELDGHKKGMTEVARNARQTSRSLDSLAASPGADMSQGLALNSTGHKEVGGRLFFQTSNLDVSLPSSLPQGKADNQILGVVEALRKLHSPRDVVLVSKDINMRVKARALGLAAEDYQNDKTLEDGDLLYSGALCLSEDFWVKHAKNIESWQSAGHTFYRISGPIVPSLHINQFVYFEAPGEPSM